MAGRALEGVASGYWTRFAKPVSGLSATAVRLRHPPLSLTKVRLDRHFRSTDHKDGLANRVSKYHWL